MCIDASARRRHGVARKTRLHVLTAVALFFAVSVVLAARPLPAVATTLAPLPIEQAASRASLVVVGTVVGTDVEDSTRGVRTAVRLWVDETLKGDAAGIVTVYVPGGRLADGSSMIVDAMASFTPDEVCCVFADENGWVLGGYQGKVRLGTAGVRDSAEARIVVERVKAALAGSDAVAASASAASVSLALAGPTIAAVTPGAVAAGTGDVVTISGSGFGASPGKVEFALDVYGVSRLRADEIDSWSDTQIVCEVPVGNVGGSIVSAGSGPLVVTAQNGSQSNPYEFRVPFGYAGVKWATPQVSYRVNTGGVDAVRREQFIDAGAAPWNAARSAFSLVDGGTTSAVAGKDGKNVICWSGSIPDGIVALTNVYADGSGQITECDMQFNREMSWGDGITPGTRDVQTIALHELGHWLCLLDQYASGDVDKVMYGFEVAGQRRQLTLNEISGIRWIYPGPSGTLHGTVRDTNDVPIAGATIAVDTCERVVSGPDGSFEVSDIPAGTYQFACSRPGYTTQHSSTTIAADETTQVDVSLGAGLQMPVHRFYRRDNGSHFYTASSAERDDVVRNLAGVYTFEGTAYSLNRLDPANSAPLFRFFNKRNGSHFYTVSLAERDRVIAQLADTYTFEGVAYLVSTAPSLASSQVYRFYNRRNGSHFYTTSPAEKNAVIRDLSSTYTFEGPAFWVAP